MAFVPTTSPIKLIEVFKDMVYEIPIHTDVGYIIKLVSSSIKYKDHDANNCIKTPTNIVFFLPIILYILPMEIEHIVAEIKMINGKIARYIEVFESGPSPDTLITLFK